MANLITILVYISAYLGIVATTFYILSYRAYLKREKKYSFEEKNLPKVTVLIPAYNEENSIARTIKSILKSDYPRNKFEVIVINDGSKDKTYEIAKKYKSKIVKVFTKKNGGKGSALNLGISKAKGEIIFTMDADTFVESYSLKNMVHYFANPKITAVTPAMMIYKPKTIWQRIQHAEYFLGVFMRKAFASVDSVYVTPGAFSAYRKEFFEKHGGYDEDNVTEDLEIALRIQYLGYSIENSPYSPAYTISPKTFRELLIQRRRWYYGHIKNIWNYRKLISRKYGDLGMFIIPVGLLSIFFALVVFLYKLGETFSKAFNEIVFLKDFGFSSLSVSEINYHVLERFFFNLFSNEIFLFILFFMVIMGGYMVWARRKIGKTPGLAINLPLYMISFALLFSFWWSVSIVYSIFVRDLKWR